MSFSAGLSITITCFAIFFNMHLPAVSSKLAVPSLKMFAQGCGVFWCQGYINNVTCLWQRIHFQFWTFLKYEIRFEHSGFLATLDGKWSNRCLQTFAEYHRFIKILKQHKCWFCLKTRNNINVDSVLLTTAMAAESCKTELFGSASLSSALISSLLPPMPSSASSSSETCPTFSFF